MKKNPKILITNAGSSLVEILTSMFVGSIVMIGVADSTLEIFKGKLRFENRMGSVFDANYLSDSLKNKIYMAGGNGLTPWQSLAVENNCQARDWFPPCAGTDRLTTVVNQVDNVKGRKTFAPNISIYRYDSANGIVTVLDPAQGGQACPLQADRTYRHILIVDRDTNQVAARWVDIVDLVGCRLQTSESLQGAILNKLDIKHNIFSTATLYSVTLNTYFYESKMRQLRNISTSTNAKTLSSGDLKVLAESIYDFQVALGYDTGLKDLILTDTKSKDDEILYNAAEDNITTLGGKGATESDLRSLSVAYVIGIHQPGSMNKIKNFDGPSMTQVDYKLQDFKKTYYFRNVFTYQ